MIGIRTSILSEHEETEWAIDDPLRFFNHLIKRFPGNVPLRNQ